MRSRKTTQTHTHTTPRARKLKSKKTELEHPNQKKLADSIYEEIERESIHQTAKERDDQNV